ncbi:MAG: DUF2808 domain-containing protein [Limnothrix sp.]
MQFFRSSISRLAIATTLLGTSWAIAPEVVDARQPCGSFTINWGGTVRQSDILSCAVEYNTGARRNDRYYLDIKKSKIQDGFKTFELSFPKEFDGEIDEERIRVKVNGKEVELIAEETRWDPDSLPNQPVVQTPQETFDNIASAAPSPNTGGELVIINGELVFLNAAELAEYEAMKPSSTGNNSTVVAPEETEVEDTSDEPRSRSLYISLSEPLKEQSEVEIILDDVDNPSSGGMYLVTAFARSQGAPLPSRLGSWFIDIAF